MSSIQLYYSGSPIKYDSQGLYYFPGGVQLTALQISGGMAAEGEIPLPFLTILGAMAMECSLAMPMISISAKMQDAMNGSVRLHGIIIVGEIGVSAAIIGNVPIQLLSFSGGMQAEAMIALHPIRIAGSMAQYGVLTCSLALPIVRVLGLLREEESTSGAIALPCLRMAGRLERSGGAMDGELSLHSLRVTGVMTAEAEYDYGTETDAVLKFSASRILI